MDFNMDNLKEQFDEYSHKAKVYFASLNTFEEVGYVFIVLGFVVFLIGILLL